MRIKTRWFDYCPNCSHRTIVQPVTEGTVRVICGEGCGQVDAVIVATDHRPE